MQLNVVKYKINNNNNFSDAASFHRDLEVVNNSIILICAIYIYIYMQRLKFWKNRTPVKEIEREVPSAHEHVAMQDTEPAPAGAYDPANPNANWQPGVQHVLNFSKDAPPPPPPSATEIGVPYWATTPKGQELFAERQAAAAAALVAEIAHREAPTDATAQELWNANNKERLLQIRIARWRTANNLLDGGRSRKSRHRNKTRHRHKKKSRKSHKRLHKRKRTSCRSTRKRKRCCKAGAYKKRVGTHTRISKRTVCYTNRKRKRCCKAGKYK